MSNTERLDWAEAALQKALNAIKDGENEQTTPGMGKAIDRTCQLATATAQLSIARSLESIAYDLSARNQS